MHTPEDITRLLASCGSGDRDSFDVLFDVVYDELRRRAHFQLRDAGGASLMTTELVHEAYLKLVGTDSRGWEDRRHFYRVAGRAMRQILVDRARKRLAGKRGGGRRALDLDRLEIPVDEACEQLLELDQALERLAAESPLSAEVVELTYFVGLTVEEAARALDMSDRTVKRLRQFGRVFLNREMADDSDLSPAAESPRSA